VRRFGTVHAQGRYLEARAIEAYAAYYKIHWPGEETEAGRPLRRSPLYQTLREKGAVYGSKFGWERPNWFAPAGTQAHDERCRRDSFRAANVSNSCSSRVRH
jgi:4-methylaminobutanoate oxidase (formaldehyde-forming)